MYIYKKSYQTPSNDSKGLKILTRKRTVTPPRETHKDKAVHQQQINM